MELEELRTLIQPVWDLIKDDCICMFLSGSCSIPFIRENHDIDVIYIYNTPEQGIFIREKLYFNEENKQLINEIKTHRIAFLGADLEKQNIIKIWSHIQPTVLFGEYIEELIPYYLVFDYEDDFLREVKKTVDYLTDKYNKDGVIKKALYHCLIIKYYCTNRYYYLTDEQIENINIAHNCEEKDKDKILELYNEVKEWIESYETLE